MQVDNSLTPSNSIHSSSIYSNFSEKLDAINSIVIIVKFAFMLLEMGMCICEGIVSLNKKRIQVLDTKDQSITHYMLCRADTVDALKAQISEKMGLTFNEIELKHNGIELKNRDVFSQMLSSVELTRRVKVSPKNSLESFYVSEDELKEKTKQQMDESILHPTFTELYEDTSNLDPTTISEWHKEPHVYHLQLTKKIPILARPLGPENLTQKYLVLSDDKIETLIKQIKQKRNTKNSIVLVYRKQFLRPDKTFADYKIDEESCMFFFQRKEASKPNHEKLAQVVI